MRIKGSAKLTWASELVDDGGDNFYMRVYPKLTNFKADRDPEKIKRVAREVLEEIKASANQRRAAKIKVKR